MVEPTEHQPLYLIALGSNPGSSWMLVPSLGCFGAVGLSRECDDSETEAQFS